MEENTPPQSSEAPAQAQVGVNAAGEVQRTEYRVDGVRRAELDHRFTYHPPINDQQRRYVLLRSFGRELALMVCENVPEGREQALAIAKIEEALFWANAGIARGER